MASNVCSGPAPQKSEEVVHRCWALYAEGVYKGHDDGVEADVPEEGGGRPPPIPISPRSSLSGPLQVPMTAATRRCAVTSKKLLMAHSGRRQACRTAVSQANPMVSKAWA